MASQKGVFFSQLGHNVAGVQCRALFQQHLVWALWMHFLVDPSQQQELHKHIAKPARSLSTPLVSYLQSSTTLKQRGCGLSRSRRRRTDHLITSRSGIHQGITEPAYLEHVVLALTSQPTWAAPVIFWHLLLSFPLRSPFLLLTHRAYHALLTTASPKQMTISQRDHSFPAPPRNLLCLSP
jgi:hypothetical protein